MTDSKAGTEASPDWSIVVPAFNEAQRLPPYLREIRDFLSGWGRTAEVIVVDDGSTDDTPGVVQSLAKDWGQLRLVRTPANRGKGHAVRSGITGSLGKRLLFTDADGSTPITELTRLERALDHGADVAIGSRALPSEETSVETSLRRKLVGRTFHLLVSILGVRGVRDTQCGFKAFDGVVGRHLFQGARTDGFGFDVEILLLAQKLGLEIAEIPVNWHHVDDSKVSVFRDSPRMAWEVVSVRLGMLTGRYANFSSDEARSAAQPGDDRPGIRDGSAREES